jgi:hypothetical protein
MNAFFAGSAPGPAFWIEESGVPIVTGEILHAELWGNLDLTLPGNMAQPLFFFGQIDVSGGDAGLIDALNPLELQLQLSNFAPSLFNLALTGNLFAQSFAAAGSGTAYRVQVPSCFFCPEPSTAMMVGAGMLGLLVVSRRMAEEVPG